MGEDRKSDKPFDSSSAGKRGKPDPPCCPDPEPRRPLERRRFRFDSALRAGAPSMKAFLVQGRKSSTP
jgi:hypothetical protein